LITGQRRVPQTGTATAKATVCFENVGLVLN
jgi:hypothetical protein